MNKITFSRQIIKVGNSIGITIPAGLEASFPEGTKVKVTLEAGEPVAV